MSVLIQLVRAWFGTVLGSGYGWSARLGLKNQRSRVSFPYRSDFVLISVCIFAAAPPRRRADRGHHRLLAAPAWATDARRKCRDAPTACLRARISAGTAPRSPIRRRQNR